MINSQLRQQIIAPLEHYQSAHLAVAGLDGPWATIVPYHNKDLTLYLLAARAGDLVYYLEDRPEAVLTIGEADAGPRSQGDGPAFDRVRAGAYPQIFPRHRS